MSSIDILNEYVGVAAFADAVDKHQRTVLRWMNAVDGLPYLKLGSRRLIHLPTARQWLLDRIHQPNPTRRASRRSAATPTETSISAAT
jgi:hypothetical protein